MTDTAPRSIELDFVAHATIELGDVHEVGSVPTGRRRVIDIVGGRFVGPRLEATILPGGADWQVVAADGTAIIDTRYTARTASGALVYVSTQGFRHGPPDVLARIAAGEAVDPDAYTFRVTARLEAGVPELEWVNRTVFVATAARQAASVTYDLYALR